jgi:hypothetical protein
MSRDQLNCSRTYAAEVPLVATLSLFRARVDPELGRLPRAICAEEFSNTLLRGFAETAHVGYNTIA